MVADKLASFQKSLIALTENEVLAGVPSKTTERKEDDDGEEINNATIAYLMENGVPELNIPARPSIVPGVKDVQPEIASILTTAVKNAFLGDMAAFQQGLDAAGLTAVKGIQTKITDGEFEPLKPATLAARQRKGRTGNKPLIDSSQFLHSINYVKRKT